MLLILTGSSKGPLLMARIVFYLFCVLRRRVVIDLQVGTSLLRLTHQGQVNMSPFHVIKIHR